MVLFSFLSYFHICFSLSYISIDHLASMLKFNKLFRKILRYEYLFLEKLLPSNAQARIKSLARLFESCPIRTHVRLCTEGPFKGTKILANTMRSSAAGVLTQHMYIAPYMISQIQCPLTISQSIFFNSGFH